MPLSERERRLLEEMERSLYSSDSDVFGSDPAKRGRPHYRSLVLGILVVIVGLGIVLTSVLVRIPLIGVGGFVVMVAGVLLAMARPRAGRGGASRVSEPSARQRSGGKGSSAPFMDRLSDRWDRRQDEGS